MVYRMNYRPETVFRGTPPGGGAMLRERYFPERKVVLISFELEDESDYALEPVKLFSKYGVKMLSCIVQSHPDRGAIHASLFLDLTDSNIDKSDLLRELKALRHVKNIELLDLPFTHGEARLVVFTLEEMHNLFKVLRELGGGGLAIMYHMGFRAGEAIATKLSGYFENNKKALEYLLLYYESLGHGRFKLESYIDGVYCRIVARELLECIDVSSGEPNSQLFRGLLSGFLSKLWGREVKVVETRCIAKGDSCCEFEARV